MNANLHEFGVSVHSEGITCHPRHGWQGGLPWKVPGRATGDHVGLSLLTATARSWPGASSSRPATRCTIATWSMRALAHMHIGGLLYSREYTEHPVISPGPCTPTRRAHARTRLLTHYHYHIAHTHVARIRIS